MANAVDERIVEAKFDASDFEKGVDKTIKKLEELKKSLNLKETGKSVTEFAKDATEGIDKAGNALDKLSQRLTTFKGMIQQNILSGLAQQVSNVFMTIEQSALRLVNELSSQQMRAGMQKYTDLLNSVRTLIVSGETQESAYEAINRLQQYSDQTNASLESMVNLMSQLKTKGMKLESATKFVEGFSNAAYSMGVNMANLPALYQNMSQVMGKKALRAEDWKTFQSFNMVGEEFRDQLLKAAKEVGTLTETVDKSGKKLYEANTKYSKEIKKSKKYAADEFESLMASNVFNEKVMEKVFAEYYHFANIEQEQLDKIAEDIKDMNEEQRKAYFEQNGLSELAYKSFLAGQEARSLTDALNTLKNAISTGWKTSFEYIFGKLDEATDFFTWLSDNELVGAIRSIGEFRNEVLKTWSEAYKGFDEENNLIGGVYNEGVTGRDQFIKALHNIDELIGSVRYGLANLFPGEYIDKFGKSITFAQSLGKSLGYATNYLEYMTRKVKEFYAEEKEVDGETKLVLKDEYVQQLGKIAKGIGAIFGVFDKLGGIALQTIRGLFYRLQPVFDAVANAVGKILEPIIDLNENSKFFDDLRNAISSLLNVLQPLIDGPLPKFIEFIGELGKFFVSIAIDTVTTNIELISEALGFIIELFGGKSGQQANDGIGVIEGWNQSLQEFSETCKNGLNAIKDFFKALFEDLRALFGISDEADGKPAGFFEKISEYFETNEFFNTFKERIKQGFIDLGDWIKEIPTKVIDIWNAIDEFIFGKKVKIKQKDKSGNTKEITGRLKSGFSLWLSTAITKIKDWLKSIPQKFTELWQTITDYLFGEDVNSSDIDPKTGKKKSIATKVWEAFSKWVDDTIANVKTWITSIPTKITELWNTVIGFFFGEKASDNVDDPDVKKDNKQTEKVKTGFQTWLEQVKTDVTRWLTEDVPELISTIWNTIIQAIFGDNAAKNTEDPVPSENTGANDKLKTGFETWLEQAKTDVTKWLTEDMPQKIANIWDGVLDFFFGEKVVKTVKDPNTNQTVEVTERVKTGFSLWLSDTITSVKEWASHIPEKVSSLWNTVLHAIFGEESFDKNVYDDLLKKDPYAADQYKKSFEKKESPILESVKETIHLFGESIGKEVVNLPTYIAQGITFKTGLLTDLLTTLQRWFKDKNEARKAGKDTGKKAKDFIDETAKQAAENAEGGEAASTLLTALSEIGSAIGGLIMTTIPGFLSEAWTYVSEESAGWLQSLGSILNINETSIDWESIEQGAKNIGTKIAEAIRSIPGIIRGAVGSISALFKRKSPLEEAREEIEASFTDKNGNIIDPKKLDEALKKAEEKFSDTPEESGLWTAIKEIGSSLAEAFIDFGPDVLNAFNRGITYINDKVGTFTKLMKNRDQNQPFSEWLQELIFGKDDGEMSELASAVSTLGETIKTLLVSTIPNFISAAFDEIISGVPKLVNKLFGGMSESIEQTEQGMTGNGAGKEISFLDMMSTAFVSLFSGANADEVVSEVEGAQEVVEAVGEAGKTVKDESSNAKGWASWPTEVPKTVGGILGDLIHNLGAFAASDLGQIGLIVWGISVAISSLTELFQLSDELRDAAKLAKWEAIKTAIQGIIGLFAYIAIAGMSGNDTQIKNAESLFDKITSLFDKLSTLLITLASLKTGRSVADMVGKIWGTAKGSGGIINAAGKGITSSVGTLINTLLAVLGVAEGGDILTTGAENWAKNMAQVFQSTGIGMEDLLGAVQNLATINDSIDSAQEALGKVGTLFQTLRELFTIRELVTEYIGDTEITGITDVTPSGVKRMSEFFFSNGVESFIGDDDAIHEASELTGRVKKAEYVTKSILTEFDKIMSMFTKLSGTMALFKQSITTNGENTTGVTDSLTNLLGLKDDMISFAQFAESNEFTQFKTALMSLGGALQLFSLADVEDFNKPLESWRVENAVGLLKQIFGNHQLKDLIQTLSADEIGDTNDLMQNAEAITIFAGALVSIARACGDITDETGGDINKLVTTLQEIKPKNGESITEISQQFGELGNAIASFAVSTIGLTETNLNNAERALKMILDLAIGLKEIPSDTVLAKVFTGDKSLENFGLGIQALGGNLRVFFGEIQNLGGNGISKDYNRNNLEQVLTALDALSNIAVRLKKVTYVGSTFQNANGWITGPIGDLTGFGQNIINFIKEINDYNIPDNKPINFDFVYNAIEAIGKLVDIPAKMPSYSDLAKRIKNVGEIISGVGTDEHNGIMGYLNQFYATVIQIASEYGGAYSAADMSSIISSYADMVKQIVDLLKIIGGQEGDVLGVIPTTNPMEYLIPVFTSINDNYEVFKTVLDNAAGFNKTGITMINDFFSAIYDLAAGLTLFSKQDENGEYNVTKGLSELLNFNWTSLSVVKDKIEAAIGKEDYTSIGKKAGQQLDAGIAEGIGTGAAIAAAQALAGAIQGEFIVSWQIRSPSKVAMGYGKMLDLGLQKGIDDNADAPIDAAETLADNVTKTTADTIGDGFDLTWEEFQALDDTMKKLIMENAKKNKKTFQEATKVAFAPLEGEFPEKKYMTGMEKFMSTLFGTDFVEDAKDNTNLGDWAEFVFKQFTGIGRTMNNLREIDASDIEFEGDIEETKKFWDEFLTNHRLAADTMNEFREGSGAPQWMTDTLNVLSQMNPYIDKLEKLGFFSSMSKAGASFIDGQTSMLNDLKLTLSTLYSGLILGNTSVFDEEEENLYKNVKLDDIITIGPLQNMIENWSQFKDMFTIGDSGNPTITPVVDMTNVNAARDQLQEMGFIPGTVLSFDTRNLNYSAQGANPNLYGKEMPDYSAELSGIQSTLASMGSTPVNVTTTMNNAQVVLDTGALVGAIIGEIDLRLGRLGFYAGRG